MSEQVKTLAERMRDRAQQSSDADVRTVLTMHANELDALSIETPIPQLVATWARARKFWCDLTGEALV